MGTTLQKSQFFWPVFVAVLHLFGPVISLCLESIHIIIANMCTKCFLFRKCPETSVTWAKNLAANFDPAPNNRILLKCHPHQQLGSHVNTYQVLVAQFPQTEQNNTTILFQSSKKPTLKCNSIIFTMTTCR